jgi:xylulokinase
MTRQRHVLSIDLGTSGLKAGVIDQSVTTLAAASASYPTLAPAIDAAEQPTDDWLGALRTCSERVLADFDGQVDAIVLTGQMPTLVALSHRGDVIGSAVTWQDSRADALVNQLLSRHERERVYQIAGTPIDGRYIIPMHLRRIGHPSYEPATLLSAKDFVYFVLTDRMVTDPSTASGFGNYSLDARTWSDELNHLWQVSPNVLPKVVDPTFAAPLTQRGAALIPGAVPGIPVYVGAADSVCAHHYVSALIPGAISVIDGSSTVIMASLDSAPHASGEILITPAADPTQRSLELDLLATGSSIAWLAQLLGISSAELEVLASGHPDPANNDVRFYPYLAGGEQGALWRNDLTGVLDDLRLSTKRADIALALFEGIAFETWRCVRYLERTVGERPVVSVATSTSRHLGAALLNALRGRRIVAITEASPALLGAAMIALEALDPLGVRDLTDTACDGIVVSDLDPHYVEAIAAKARRYFAAGPVANAVS